jgi:putative ATP-dependent endonuclease of the OLD family
LGIRSVQIRGFRSIASSGLDKCGDLNILIGKNNAGKSNILGAIELVLLHLKQGRIAGSWPIARRPSSEFTDANVSTPLRIGVEFDLPRNINAELRERLTKEAPHLERSIEQIKAHDAIVFILAAAMDGDDGFLFVEQLAAGKLTSKGEDLAIEGSIRLLSVTKSVGLELYTNLMSARLLTADIESLQELSSERRLPYEFLLQQPKERRVSILPQYVRLRPELIRQLGPRVASASSREDIENGINQMIVETREKMHVIEKRETEGALAAFAGDSKSAPAYAEWLIEQFGSIPFLHIKERKEEIGRDEALTLLKLKTRRGGPERLETIQQTVRELLGVKLDAFEAETPAARSGAAEMDVDDFLIEANGAGIREALRIILDLELKNPKIVLIEEPEVHLHPGLSRVLAGYLREKSEEMQMFVTTHSTDFVDSVSFQYVFLVSRDARNRTSSQTVEAEEGALRIPAELGLRLSTVFMFDRLIFVEGPSDESVLRELAKKIQVDLTKANVGFVYMAGARNFAYFAAESTLELLSRRRIQMWFVTDRDENTDAETERMMERLGGRAKLKVLLKREIENYLLDGSAIVNFLEEKQRAGGISGPKPSREDVERVLTEQASGLREEVIRLRTERQLLTPVFLRTRTNIGTIEERIKNSITALGERLDKIEGVKSSITREIDESWAARALDYVPGTVLLERIAKQFGVGFSKDKGDSERLARYVPAASVDAEIRGLLCDVIREEAHNA